MIDLYFLAQFLGLPFIGGFLGTQLALYVTCPNRGCCQVKKIRKVIEGV